MIHHTNKNLNLFSYTLLKLKMKFAIIRGIEESTTEQSTTNDKEGNRLYAMLPSARISDRLQLLREGF